VQDSRPVAMVRACLAWLLILTALIAAVAPASPGGPAEHPPTYFVLQACLLAALFVGGAFMNRRGVPLLAVLGVYWAARVFAGVFVAVAWDVSVLSRVLTASTLGLLRIADTGGVASNANVFSWLSSAFYLAVAAAGFLAAASVRRARSSRIAQSSAGQEAAEAALAPAHSAEPPSWRERVIAMIRRRERNGWWAYAVWLVPYLLYAAFQIEEGSFHDGAGFQQMWPLALPLLVVVAQWLWPTVLGWVVLVAPTAFFVITGVLAAVQPDSISMSYSDPQWLRLRLVFLALLLIGGVALGGAWPERRGGLLSRASSRLRFSLG
jgi:hypothetical protein